MTQLRATPARQAPPDKAPALHDRAIDNLDYIRQAMERAGSFTAVSGSGIVAVGGVAVLAAFFADRQAGAEAWLAVWLAAAAIAVAVAFTLTARKARAMGLPLVSGAGRKFALALTPTLVAGAVLTAVLGPASRDLLVGLWLLLYGAGVTAGGAFSVPVVPVMGAAFMAGGVLTFLLPPAAANWMMLAGFGGLHLVFGIHIARRYGG